MSAGVSSNEDCFVERTLGEARVPFEVPRADALHERLASVLEVVYLVFNEGHTATGGEDWMRPALTMKRSGSGACWRNWRPGSPRSMDWWR